MDTTLYGLITHNVVPMRAEPSGSSEQVSQCIIGDTVRLLEARHEYTHIQSSDGYEGWIWHRHLELRDPADNDKPHWPFDIKPNRAYYVTALNLAPLHAKPGENKTLITHLPIGAWVRKLGKVKTADDTFLRVAVPSGSQTTRKLLTGYMYEWDLDRATKNLDYAFDFTPYMACTFAHRFLGTPYLWGGTTPFGFDCSGFVQRVFSLMNVTLPRDAHQQAESPLGLRLSETAKTQPADLVFFSGQSDPLNRGITHVGMAYDSKHYIHAVGKEGVILTRFDDPYYRSRYTYRGAWRLLA